MLCALTLISSDYRTATLGISYSDWKMGHQVIPIRRSYSNPHLSGRSQLPMASELVLRAENLVENSSKSRMEPNLISSSAHAPNQNHTSRPENLKGLRSLPKSFGSSFRKRHKRHRDDKNRFERCFLRCALIILSSFTVVVDVSLS